MMIGYIHEDDGERWLRIEDAFTGDVWDEPAADYENVLDLVRGDSYWRNKRTQMRVYPE